MKLEPKGKYKYIRRGLEMDKINVLKECVV